MALRSILASALALSGLASAGVVRRTTSIHSGGGDLLSFRADDGTADDTPVHSTADNVVLKPLRPNNRGKTTRDTTGAFKVLNEDHLYWAGHDGTVTELRIEMNGKTEGIVDAEYFDHLIEHMECPRNGTGKLSIRFSDKLDFDSAADVWKWVKQEDDHQFVLMVGAGDCGWNDDRILYKINDLDFDDPTNTAHLHAKYVSWKEALHSYDLKIGKEALDNAETKSAMAKRGFGDISYNPEVTVPFTTSIPKNSISFPFEGVDVTAKCLQCSTSGSFNIEGHFSVRFLDLKEASIVMSTAGINAIAQVEMELKGAMSEKLMNKSEPILKLSPAGVSIPKILTIGPTITIALEAGVSELKGALKLTFGGKASIGQSSATLNFLSQDKTTTSGWGLSLDADPLKADTSVELKAFTALTASVGLEISALETGFSAELAANLPSLGATIKAVDSSTCSLCENKYSKAIDGSVKLTSDLSIALKKKKKGSYEKLFSVTLAEKTLKQLPSFCRKLGVQLEQCSK